MPAPATMRLMRQTIAPELEAWPGVVFHLDQTSRRGHPRVILHYQGRSRFVVLPGSPSCQRVGINIVCQLRRELVGLGAERQP